jgi:hypothetical protein
VVRDPLPVALQFGPMRNNDAGLVGPRAEKELASNPAEDVQVDNLEERSQAESSSSHSASFLIAMAGCILSFERGL